MEKSCSTCQHWFNPAHKEPCNSCGNQYLNFTELGKTYPIPDEPEMIAFSQMVVAKPSNPKDAISDKKIPLWLCSPIAKAQWAVAQYAGMLKYGAWNWRVAGVRSSVYLSAMQRHMDAYLSGEELDPVDGTHHLANIMACAAILLDAKAASKLTDDRPPSVEIRGGYDALMATMEKLREKYKHLRPTHCTNSPDA